METATIDHAEAHTTVEYGAHTEAAQRSQRQQAELAAAAEGRRRARTMVVPTDDAEVRAWLRRLREPMTLFGERALERRERLRVIVAALSDEDRDALTEQLMRLEVAQRKTPTGRFFTEGPPRLADLRMQIAQFSAQRAAARLGEQRAVVESGDAGAEARIVLEAAERLNTQGSQYAGARPAQGVSVSSDGRTIVTADWSGVVSLWPLESRLARAKQFQAHEERCTDVQWHPAALTAPGDGQDDSMDGSQIAYATASADATAKLWDAHGQCRHTFTGHSKRLARLAFHPMGDTLATCSFDMTWRLWDLATGEALAVQEGHIRPVYCAAFHPDGSLCASGGLDAITRVWDCRSGRNILTFQGHARGILSIGFSPNGYHVASGSIDNSCRVWDLRKRGALYCITGHSKLVSHVQFDPHGGYYLLTSSYDGTCKLWSSSTWQLCTCLAGNAGRVMSADIARDSGAVVTVSYDKLLTLWYTEAPLDQDGDATQHMDTAM